MLIIFCIRNNIKDFEDKEGNGDCRGLPSKRCMSKDFGKE
jgi:hypothetical protein